MIVISLSMTMMTRLMLNLRDTSRITPETRLFPGRSSTGLAFAENPSNAEIELGTMSWWLHMALMDCRTKQIYVVCRVVLSLEFHGVLFEPRFAELIPIENLSAVLAEIEMPCSACHGRFHLSHRTHHHPRACGVSTWMWLSTW